MRPPRLFLFAVVAIAVAIGVAAALTSRPRLETPVVHEPVVEWTGPVRVQEGPPAVVTAAESRPRADGPAGPIPLWGWAESVRDARPPGINIAAVEFDPGDVVTWYVALESYPPRTVDLDADQPVIAYGVVLDVDSDGLADYELGMSNEAPAAGDLRLWITDLATGETDEHVGRPNGEPYEEWHPDSRISDDEGRQPRFTFPEAQLSGLDSASVRFYAWSSMTDGRDVVAWDYAPDAAWVTLPAQP